MATTSDVPASIVDAALNLAETQGWRRVTLAAIAAQSGEPLSRIHAEFPSKDAILTAFARRVDAAVLKEPPETTGSVRDRLFDLLMRRFDALAPHRAAIRAIIHDTFGDPQASLAGLCAVHRAMSLTLEAADVSTSGPFGQLRVKVLGAIYLRSLYDWLHSESDDTERVMAQLDKALAQVERIATSFAGQRDRLRARRDARRSRRRTAGDAGETEASEPA